MRGSHGWLEVSAPTAGNGGRCAGGAREIQIQQLLDQSTTSPSFALVCTADDFGIGLATSRGIIRAHLAGPVTATSMMTVCGDHAAASVPLLQEAPRLDVGLHLVLSGGERPLRRLARSGLVGRDGRFLSNGRLWTRAWTGQLARAAVLEEIAAQAERFGELLGRAPAYVDGHHHAHQLPTIRGALIEAMDLGLLPRRTRSTVESGRTLRCVSLARAKRLAAQVLGVPAAAEFARRSIRSNDWIIAMLGDADLHALFPWRSFIEHMPRHGVVEWVVHPGFFDKSIVGRDPYVEERIIELAALTSPERRHYWEAIMPYLTTKSAVWGQVDAA